MNNSNNVYTQRFVASWHSVEKSDNIVLLYVDVERAGMRLIIWISCCITLLTTLLSYIFMTVTQQSTHTACLPIPPITTTTTKILEEYKIKRNQCVKTGDILGYLDRCKQSYKKWYKQKDKTRGKRRENENRVRERIRREVEVEES